MSGKPNSTNTSRGNITPIIPQTDKRNYSAFVLENGLKALVISDPNTDKCAVALNVRIGALSDPVEVQGLAHFCEHMLFMGSEAYPEENYFTKLVSESNGTYNAYTSPSNTNYFFEARNEKLFEILDVFANFFISPLFTESATDREMNAVNSEHEQNIVSDIRRMCRLQCYLAGPNHDFSKFTTGNLKTLRDDPQAKGIDVRSKLLEFYHKFYSANIMTICLFGQESVELLELAIKEKFSNIKNSNVIAPSWNSPWNLSQLKKIVYVEPIKDIHQIHMMWPVPDYSKSYLSKSAGYLSHLIGHETKGSILYELKEKNLAHDLLAGVYNYADGISHMNITILIYKEATEKIFEVMKIVYEYIFMLKEQGPQRSIFEELKSMNEVKFRFKEESVLERYVSNIALNMPQYNAEDYIKGPYMYEEFSETQINDILSCVVPEKMRVYVFSKENKVTYQGQEPFYGTKYTEMDIPDSSFQMLSSVTSNPVFHLPPKNDFLVSDFSLKTPVKNISTENYPEYRDIPELQFNSSGYRWWFCENTLYEYPKGGISLHLFNKSTVSDPLNNVYMRLLTTILKDNLNDTLYDASLVGLKFIIETSTSGLQFIFQGFNEKMSILVNKVLHNLVQCEVTHDQFENAKSRLFRSLRNLEKETPFIFGYRLLESITNEVQWLPNDLIEIEPHVTLNSYKQFFETVLCTLSVEGLIYGNFTRMESDIIYQEIQQILKTLIHRPMHSMFLPISRQIWLPENSNYVFQMKTEHSSQSALVVYLQCLKRSTRNDVITKLLNNILKDPFFNVLRTKEQLGYVVSNHTKTTNSTLGLHFLVQSDKPPQFIDERINKFLSDFYDELKSMPKETFEAHREGLISKVVEKPKDMSRYFHKLLQEIDECHYNFERVNEQKKALDEITKEEIIQFYEKSIHPESSMLKKLSVHMVSTQAHKNYQYKTTETSNKDHDQNCPTDPVWFTFDQLNRFKRSMPLSELYEPPIAIVCPQPKL